ncbi:MAG: phosphatase PAP2 family protein [Chitinophagaceae bacterium]|jgi:membrane-associated phospholipid phosphatase|nr:phosphatase PAP2 family protein [Chitinophagaceae bacterium]
MNWKYNHPLRNVFVYAVFVLLTAGIVVLLCWGKEAVFLKLNHQHSDLSDVVLKYFTFLGEGLLMAILGVVLFLIGKRKLGILMLISFVLSGLLAQGIKRVKKDPRPGLYFQKKEMVHNIDGELLKGRNSFPSGHTTTAFAMFSLLSFATRNKAVQFLYFAAACTVGYSRIYLGQHFTEDVLAGAALGVLTSLVLLWVFRNKDWD